MTLFKTIEEHKDTLIICEALGFLHNLGKLDKRFPGGGGNYPFDFCKISNWDYLCYNIDNQKIKNLQNLLKDEIYQGNNPPANLNNQAASIANKNIMKQVAVHLCKDPPQKGKIENLVETLWQNNADEWGEIIDKQTPCRAEDCKKKSHINRRPSGQRDKVNRLLKHMIEEYNLPKELRSGYFLFRLSVLADVGAESGQIRQFIRQYFGWTDKVKIEFIINGETFSPSMLLNIFWDKFHHRGESASNKRHDILSYWLGKDNSISDLARLMAVCHEAISRGDKPSEKQEDFDTKMEDHAGDKLDTEEPIRPVDYWTNVFGRESEQNTKNTFAISELMNRLTTRHEVETEFKQKASDYRKPFNDVSLYAYCRNFGAFFKTAVATVILKEKFPEPHLLQWRVLYFRINSLEWIFRGARMADVMARKKIVDEIYTSVADFLENKFPLFSSIYSDINGLIFLAPDYENMLEMDVENNCTLAEKIRSICLKKSNDELAVNLLVSGPVHGYDINIGNFIHEYKTPQPDMEKIKKQWEDAADQGHFMEVCTTCALRPVAGKGLASDNKLCSQCHQRKTNYQKKCA